MSTGKSAADDKRDWLTKFCKDVFVEPGRVAQATSIVQGGVDGFIARHGESEEPGERRLLEQAIWFAHDTSLLDSQMSLSDRREAVLDHLEKVHCR